MVLSILIATIMAPGLLGSQEAIRQSQSKEKREEHRARRCNLIANCVKASNRSQEINGRRIVLRNGKLWIDTGTDDGSSPDHAYAGYYLPYPDTKYEGLVTTITDVAPVMNWVYVDKDTYEVKYGVRLDAQPNLTGPFNCTRQDRRLTFDGWEGWCAVEVRPGSWALYFDIGDDGLKSKVAPGMRVLELELSRTEKRFQKETEARQQDQTTQRAVDTEANVPVDQPLTAEALESRPGAGNAQENSATTDPKPLRPFKIPTSIFDDPPPLVAPLEFRPIMPKTPPPAYTPAFQEKTMVGPTPDSTHQPKKSDPDVTTSTPQNQAPKQARISPNKTSASPPAPLNTSPSEGKRTIPKLNRNSGTKALAQAQMFEAIAAGKSQKEIPGEKSPDRTFRASSNVGYASSEYSNDGQDTMEKIKQESGVSAQPRASSLTPVPLSLALSDRKAPPVRMQATKTPASILDRSVQTTVERSRPTPAADPAISAGRSGTVRPLNSTRRPRETRQQSTTGSSQRRYSQNSGQGTFATRQRQRSTSNQPYTKSPSPRSSSNPAPQLSPQLTRSTLARTMTTGIGNRGMENRLAEKNEVNVPVRRRANTAQSGGRTAATARKTTSALFREIDDLIKQDTSVSGAESLSK